MCAVHRGNLARPTREIKPQKIVSILDIYSTRLTKSNLRFNNVVVDCTRYFMKANVIEPGCFVIGPSQETY